MDNPKAQLSDKLKNANNVLVTVSRNPSVDQLSAMLGMALLLNKLGKHAAAVYSGETPSTIEFLKPEDTIEKNTDSLRDFIIALDKSKADKLRYKVEDQVVRIFITPYRTSINQDDLDFSQGDFNVDVVIALGVREQQDLDEAILAHGRILHDATVATINTTDNSQLGAINWRDDTASSLSELVTDLARNMGKDLLDTQIATALLTGIVAETNRFSNEKTTSATMSISAALMAAGANQQLVATKLDQSAGGPVMATPAADSDQPPADGEASSDGTLSIKHRGGDADAPDEANHDDSPESSNEGSEDHHGDEAEDHLSLPAPEPDHTDDTSDLASGNKPLPMEGAMPSKAPTLEPFHEDQAEAAKPGDQPELPPPNQNLSAGSRLITEPPTHGGELTANTKPEPLDPGLDTLGDKPRLDESPLLTRKATLEPTPAVTEFAAEPADAQPGPGPGLIPAATPITPVPEGEAGHQTLAQLEQEVHSPHTTQEPAQSGNLDAARSEVSKALSGNPLVPEPIVALNSSPLGGSLHPLDTPPAVDPAPQPVFSDVLQQAIPQVPNPATPLAAVPQTSTPPPEAEISFDPNAFSTSPTVPDPATQPAATVIDPTAPPPVPPPIPFQFGASPPAPPASS